MSNEYKADVRHFISFHLYLRQISKINAYFCKAQSGLGIRFSKKEEGYFAIKRKNQALMRLQPKYISLVMCVVTSSMTCNPL